MKMRMIAAIAAAGLAATPALAMADLQVTAGGAQRVVAESTQGGSCSVRRGGNGTIVTCPDGAKGTMSVYASEDGAPVCELDFWYEGAAAGTKPWRVQVSHRNQAAGTCSSSWNADGTMLLMVTGANG